MSKLVPVLAVVVIVAVAGAGAAIFLLNNNKDTTPTATILIEDQNGVYFWAEGKGDTIADALGNLSPGVTVTMTDASFGKYISAVNGLAETPYDPAKDSNYWSFYVYDGTAWKMSDLGVSSVKTSESPTVALFYVTSDKDTYAIKAGGPDNVTVPKVEDKVVWDGSTSGTVFAITSHTGMYFYINSAKAGTMLERFQDATNTYKIAFEASSSGGISTVFGKGTVKIDEDYLYWVQYSLEDGNWAKQSSKMGNIENADSYAQFALIYAISSMSTGIDTPLPPIYKAS